MLFVLECTELLAQTIFFKCVFYYCFRLSNSDLLHVMYSIAAFCFVIFMLIQLYCKCASDVPCSVHIYRRILGAHIYVLRCLWCEWLNSIGYNWWYYTYNFNGEMMTLSDFGNEYHFNFQRAWFESTFNSSVQSAQVLLTLHKEYRYIECVYTNSMS